MKKIFAIVAALAVAGLIAVPVSACIGPDGKPVEGKDGVQANCSEATERTDKILDHFSVDNALDFGRVTELDRSYTKQLTISNNTANDVIIDATVEAYMEADGKSRELSDWIAFVGGVSHFSVAKGATYSLSVRAAVPSDAISGSQYALIKLTDSNNYTAEVVARLDVSGDKLEYNSEVSGAWIDPVHLDENLNANATVKNTGTAGFASTFQIKSKSFFGGDWQVIAEESAEVLPGKEQSFKNNSKLGFGIYNVEQRVTYVNNEGRMIESLITRTVVNLPWWSVAIAGGIILLIIIIVVIAKKKGKKRSEEGSAPSKMPKVDEETIEEIEEQPAEEPESVKEKPAEEPKPVAKPVARPAAKPVARPADKPKSVRKVIKIQ